MTLHRRAFAAALLALPVAAQPRDVPPEVAAALPDARPQGRGRMSFIGLHLYDIRLFGGAQRVGSDWATTPLALAIDYARSFDGGRIAERSLAEMKRQGTIDAATGERWLAAMRRLFPDVQAGDRLTGMQRPGEAALFFLNGSPRGEVRDAAFTQRFFGIWLSPQTSEPALRDSLLGDAR